MTLRALLLPFLATAALAAPASALADARIVGGTDAPDDVYDAVAKVEVAQAAGCTGTLIAPEWVITAGHCGSVTLVVATPVGFPPGAIQVTLGTTAANGNGGETIIADQVIPSPDYLLTDGYDVALLHLLTPSKQTPVKISGRGAESLWAPGVMQTIAGFGVTEEDGSAPDTMQVAQVPIVDDATCKAAYPDSFEDVSQICAGYKEGGIDTCQGDSGGPLFGKDALGVLKLDGVTSYGDGCARPGKYGVYGRIADATLREWVREVVPEAIDDQVVTSTSGDTSGGGTGGGTDSGGTSGGGTGTSSTGSGTSPAALRASLAVTRASRRALRRRGVQIRLGCGTSCVGVMDLRLDARTVKRLGLKSARVGRMTVRLDKAGRATRRFAIARPVASRIAKQRRAKLSVVARVSGDAGGVTLQRRVALKR